MLARRVENCARSERAKIRKTKLLLAAAELMEVDGFHALTIAEIVRRSGAARGTFYIYFKNKSDISLAVINDFREQMFDQELTFLEGKNWKEKIYLTNLYYFQTCALNAGLMRTFHQLVDVAEEYRKLRSEDERDWALKLYHSYAHAFGLNPDEETKTQILRNLHSLRTMAHRISHELYIERSPALMELFPTQDDLAETTTNIWVRIISHLSDHSSSDS